MATNAADRYLLEGTPSTLRMNGVAEALPSAAPLTRVDLKTVVALLMPEPQRSAFEATGEAKPLLRARQARAVPTQLLSGDGRGRDRPPARR